MLPACFPLLILNARPAAGKSEIIHYLQSTPEGERIERFHIGALQVFDDFPMLWAWFEEDHILEHVFQRPRLHTTPDGYFVHDDLWHLLIHRLCLAFEKWLRDAPRNAPSTAIIEFSRGASHGGYRTAYTHLSETVLARASSLYIHVTYQESLRKNRTRFNPEREGSILQHSLPEEKMERLYREDDWESFCAKDPHYLLVDHYRIPYAVFENEDDLTTQPDMRLQQRLQQSLGRLWDLHQQRPSRPGV
jgi:hypothetical protein